MSLLQKVSLSLLITVLVFAVSSVLAFKGGFELIENRYYKLRVENTMKTALSEVREDFDLYIQNIMNLCAAYSLDKKTASYLEREVSTAEEESRTELTGKLFEHIEALEGVRLVEKDGIRIHYSSFGNDVLMQSDNLISYKNYPDVGDTDFAMLTTADTGAYVTGLEDMLSRAQLYLDTAASRFIISMPCFDRYTAYRGTLLFYIYADSFARDVMAKNRVPLNARFRLVAPSAEDAVFGLFQTESNSGMVFNMPQIGQNAVSKAVVRLWDKSHYGIDVVFNIPKESEAEEGDDGDALLLLTDASSKWVKIGWLYSQKDFTFSNEEKFLLLTCLFMTVFLLVCLLFSLKKDDEVLINSRIHKFELALFKEFLLRKNDRDWQNIEKRFAARQQDINAELVRSLGKVGKRNNKEINTLLDKSWTSLVQVMENATKTPPVLPEQAEGLEPLEEVEELEELEDVSEATTAKSASEASSDGLEELEGAEDVEELDAVEELEPLGEAEAPQTATMQKKADLLNQIFVKPNFDHLDSEVDYAKWREK